MAYIEITSPDGRFGAYIARPQHDTASTPAIVVCQEIFGINADMRQTCDELAAQGFIALCPDLFWRLEAGVELSHIDGWPKALSLYQAFDLNAGVRDVAATLQAASQVPGASGRVGLTGYCLGGLMTYLSAARGTVDAAVAYYGGRTEEFLDEAPNIRSPLLMHLGEEDEFIPKAAQETIVSALAGQSDIQVHRYPGCMHAFARHGGTHYDASAAQKANARTLDFFKSRLAS